MEEQEQAHAQGQEEGQDTRHQDMQAALEQSHHQVRSLLAIKLPKTGLNTTCNDKMCVYLESALSCKALNFRLSKICVRYFLGYLYACPVFPAPSEIYQAPSVCIGELLNLVPAELKAKIAPSPGTTLCAYSLLPAAATSFCWVLSSQ